MITGGGGKEAAWAAGKQVEKPPVRNNSLTNKIGKDARIKQNQGGFKNGIQNSKQYRGNERTEEPECI